MPLAPVAGGHIITDRFTESPDPHLVVGTGSTASGKLVVPYDTTTQSLSVVDLSELSPSLSVTQTLKVESLPAVGQAEIFMSQRAYPVTLPVIGLGFAYTQEGYITALGQPGSDSCAMCLILSNSGLADVIVLQEFFSATSYASVQGSSDGVNLATFVPSLGFPFWLVLTSSPTGGKAELWYTDPDLSGAPAFSLEGSLAMAEGECFPICEFLGEGSAGGPVAETATLGEWLWGGKKGSPFVPPWPYPRSAVVFGDHSTGVIRAAGTR